MPLPTWEIYVRDRERNQGKGDIDFLKYAFSKLVINFTWWVNRKDKGGNNLFSGGLPRPGQHWRV